jgi:hypothetical protein
VQILARLHGVTERADKDDRPVYNRRRVGRAGEQFHAQRHRQFDVDDVAGFPPASQGDERAARA